MTGEPLVDDRTYDHQMLGSDDPSEASFVAVGIDVAEERKGIDLVALDARRQVVVSQGHLSVVDIARIVLEEIQPAIVCIDSPSGWSLGEKSRVAERELRRFGITAFSTGTDPGDHPFYRWMRVGFALFEALSSRYPLYRGGCPEGTAAEVFPEATAVLLAGRLRESHESKRGFRGAVLRVHGVDPDSLPTVDRIDAALGALTGVRALEGDFGAVGHADEGTILLPINQLPAERLIRRGSPIASREGLTDLVGRDRTESGDGICLCGCGATVRRRFLPGHDSKLKSELTRAHRFGDRGATDRLILYGWLRKS